MAKSAPLVLIVDDFEDNREMYAQYLRFHGYDVAEADNGQEALRQASGLHPDVIVMDLSLPGMDGWEATRRLKQDAATRDIPVIALTGHALTGSEHTAREAGCDRFLTKPCAPSVLGQEIRRVLPGSPPARRS
ncbi:MAG TPA: response regulator [Vicinamibacteria bacterium]|nr:response regulator [Vicinamibacteria bacterium]